LRQKKKMEFLGNLKHHGNIQFSPNGEYICYNINNNCVIKKSDSLEVKK
jgi:hypothetical protein